MLKAAQAYLHTQVNTTSQAQLLLMLYDGGIKFLKQAKIKIEEKNFAEKGILISKALDIIAELDGSLNPEKGGDLATNLHHLYFYCNTRLLQANLKMDTTLIDEVINILLSLRDAFAQISGEAPAQQSAAPANNNGARAKAFGQAAGVSLQTSQSPKPAPSQTQQQAPAPKTNVTPLPKQGKQAPTAAPAPKPAQEAKAKTSTPQQSQGEKHAPEPEKKAAETQGAPTEQKVTATPKQSRLLAGANIYKRMASQE